MTERKNFNYRTATVEQIAEHFKLSTRQAIHAVRANWKGNDYMTDKLNQAFILYKTDKLKESLSVA